MAEQDDLANVTNPAPVSDAAQAPTADAAASAPADVVASIAGAEQQAHDATLLDKFDDKAKATSEAKPDATPEAPKVEAKPEDAKPEEKPADAPADEKPAEPVEEPKALDPIAWFDGENAVKIPDTIKLDDATKGELTGALETLRADPHKGAQALIDLHAKSINQLAEHMQSEQWRVFRDTNQDWITQVMADPILGGAGHDTAMAKVAIARDHLASSAKPGTPQYEADMTEFKNFLRITGAGNHPAFLRMMHNASRYVREAEPPPPGGKPPKDAGKNPGAKGLRQIYDHPTSQAGN